MIVPEGFGTILLQNYLYLKVADSDDKNSSRMLLENGECGDSDSLTE